MQLKTGRKPYTAYFPETGQTVYEQNRKKCGAKSKLLIASEFFDFACVSKLFKIAKFALNVSSKKTRLASGILVAVFLLYTPCSRSFKDNGPNLLRVY